MPNEWINSYHQTNETEILDNDGVKIHDLIEEGQTFDENVYPVLFAKLGSNTVPSMSMVTGSPAPWKVIADATQRIHTEQHTEQYT